MILNVELVNNHMREVREFTLTAEKTEEIISRYPYGGEGLIKDPVVENTQFPPIALPFYAFIYEYDTVPSPETLIELYLSQECFHLVSEDCYELNYGETKKTVSKEGLIARILRTYPSIVRDLHFYLMAVESKLFEGVWYSFEDDYRNGIDIKVKHNHKWYKVALMQNTRRSIFFRNRKRYRHDGKNSDVINVELDPRKSQRCGDYNLYTPEHVKEVYSKINK